MADVFFIFDTVIGGTDNYAIGSTQTPAISILNPDPSDNVSYLSIASVYQPSILAVLDGGAFPSANVSVETKRGTWK